MKKVSVNWAFIFFLLVLAGGAALRLCLLDQRPMHTDEAVHGIKFGELLEQHRYRYDPVEYHGPLLNYSTLIPAALCGARTIAEVTETTLRTVPAVYGLLLILGLLLLRQGMSRTALAAAAVTTALAPALVFYSRYYIQEMLLTASVFGVIGCGFRYARSRRWGWAVAAGICLGLMHASKETAVLSVGAMGLALLLTVLAGREGEPGKPFQPFKLFGHLVGAAAAAVAVSALFYSSFFTHPSGIIDSVLTYVNYAGKAASHEWHQHPWDYYFRLLLVDPVSGRITWREMPLLVLSLTGIAGIISGYGVTFEDRRLRKFLLFYALILSGGYSLLPYKTPWSMLGFYHGFVLLAGFGAAVLFRASSRPAFRIVLIIVFTAAAGYYGRQSWLLNFTYDTDPRNPWVYAQTTRDIPAMSRRVHELAAVHPDRKGMFIEVVAPEHDYWPLPWYFRDLPNTGWWTFVDTHLPAAPVIIAFPRFEGAVLKQVYELPPPGETHLYLPVFPEPVYLRPNVEIRGYVRKDLMDRLAQSGADNG
ncbi:TIGR03663 family protein [bacterium]|nr:TIGR03663 family protein [bacterium]